MEEAVNGIRGSRIRKVIVMALVAVGFGANADGIIGNPLGPLPDLNRECFEDLSKPSEPDTYRLWLSERKGDDGTYSFVHTAGLGWKDTSVGYADGYPKTEWHYEPKAGVFGHNHSYDYDPDAYCAPVPEPQTWVMMMMGLLGVVALRCSKGRIAAE
jgi:PEP-CTERM motif